MLLLVEDDLVTRFIYEEWFGEREDVRIAENVEMALEIIENTNISHCISDFNLDDKSAVDLFQAIGDKEIKLALALGSELKKDQELALSSFSIDKHFKKPLDQAALMAWFEAK